VAGTIEGDYGDDVARKKRGLQQSIQLSSYTVPKLNDAQTTVIRRKQIRSQLENADCDGSELEE